MSKVLITGGAGFIGSHIVERLVHDGERVVVLDNLSTGKRENLIGVRDDISFIKGDIRDLDVVQKGMRGIDYVLHTAAQNSVPRSIEDPIGANNSNILGTLHVLMAACRNDVRRVVFSSSSSVYGRTKTGKQVETMRPRPVSPYALSKMVGEYYCKMFYELYRLETVVLRYFNVFGPRQDPSSEYAAVIPLFVSSLVRDDVPTIHGDGTQSRDFTYVSNVVDANICALSPDNGKPGQVYNIACGETTSINTLYNTIRQMTGKDIVPKRGVRRPGDINFSKADIRKAESHLGWLPRVSLNTGLEKTVEWHQERVMSMPAPSTA